VKLLEDMPSAVTHRPTRQRSGVTLIVTVVLLVVAALIGFILMTSGGTSGDDPAEAAAGPAGADVTLATWVDGSTSACAAVANEYPVMALGAAARTDGANVAAIDAGTRQLVATVRDLPLPTTAADAAEAGAVVALGDQAEQTWYGLSGTDAAKITPEQLTEASDQNAAFVSGLVALGADCSALG
jgi:hypothetical protein